MADVAADAARRAEEAVEKRKQNMTSAVQREVANRDRSEESERRRQAADLEDTGFNNAPNMEADGFAGRDGRMPEGGEVDPSFLEEAERLMNGSTEEQTSPDIPAPERNEDVPVRERELLDSASERDDITVSKEDTRVEPTFEEELQPLLRAEERERNGRETMSFREERRTADPGIKVPEDVQLNESRLASSRDNFKAMLNDTEIGELYRVLDPFKMTDPSLIPAKVSERLNELTGMNVRDTLCDLAKDFRDIMEAFRENEKLSADGHIPELRNLNDYTEKVEVAFGRVRDILTKEDPERSIERFKETIYDLKEMKIDVFERYKDQSPAVREELNKLEGLKKDLLGKEKEIMAARGKSKAIGIAGRDQVMKAAGNVGKASSGLKKGAEGLKRVIKGTMQCLKTGASFSLRAASYSNPWTAIVYIAVKAAVNGIQKKQSKKKAKEQEVTKTLSADRSAGAGSQGNLRKADKRRMEALDRVI